MPASHWLTSAHAHQLSAGWCCCHRFVSIVCYRMVECNTGCTCLAGYTTGNWLLQNKHAAFNSVMEFLTSGDALYVFIQPCYMFFKLLKSPITICYLSGSLCTQKNSQAVMKYCLPFYFKACMLSLPKVNISMTPTHADDVFYQFLCLNVSSAWWAP